MGLLKKTKRYVTFIAIGALSKAVNHLPRSVAMFLGNWIGLATWVVSHRERHNIRRNLGLAFGDELKIRERDRIGRSFFINSAKNVIDMVRFEKHYSSEINGLIETEGMEHWEEAYNRGRGMIGLTGHLGNFELMAVHLTSIGYQVGAIGRKMYDARLDEMLTGNRRASGVTNFATTDSPRKFLRWLQDGNVLGVLMDTDSHRVRSMYVPSFGRLSYTPVGHIALAIRTQSPIVPIACLRTEADRYRVVVLPAIECPPGKASDADIFRVASECNRALDTLISRYREQWIWVHNRWHTNPDL